MTQPTPPPSDAVADDILCRRCGYDLRGLARDALCSECGTPVARSLTGNLLKNADPEWLERVRFGASLKLWNLVLGLLVGVVASILLATGLPPAVVMLITSIGGALGLWATFLITTQEPRIALQEDTVTLRRVLRTCAVAGFLGTLLQYAGAPANVSLPLTGGPSGAWSIFLPILGGLLGLAGMFVLWGELLYLRRLAVRIPDEKLTKSTTLIMWTLPITGGLAIVFGIAVALAAAPAMRASPGTAVPPPVPPPAMAAGGFAVGVCALSAFALYLGLWYIRLLVRYRRGFALAAEQSRAAGPA